MVMSVGMAFGAKIYVAGHQGLVGSAIVRHLVSQGYTNIITRTAQGLDLRRQRPVEDFFAQEQPEYVFLAAAKVGGILANNTYRADFIYDNLMIAINVIHASHRYGVKKLINLGSSCIYPKNALQPLKEEYLLSGYLETTNEPYAIAKIAAIKLCRYYNEQHGTNFISVMPTNLYGPGDNFNLETAHVLPALMRKFHLAKLCAAGDWDSVYADLKLFPIGYGLDAALVNHDQKQLQEILALRGVTATGVRVWGSGKPLREFLYVDDLAQALLFLMNHQQHTAIGECINIGVGQDLSIQALAHMIKQVVGFDGAIIFDPTKPDGTVQKLLDVTRINILGWQASVSLPRGVEYLYQWYFTGAL